jgi:RND family efflux transporter MFP subunit
VDVIELEQWVENFKISSQGTVRPRTETILSAEVSGAITSISPKFTAGGVFEKGEVLLRIDPTNYDVAVKKAEALLKQRQIEYDGASKLRTQGYRAESEYASAAAALAAAQAELVSAKRNLERTYIRLPYEGMVRSKDSDLGQFVTPGTRLGITFATDYAEVRLPLTDRDLAFVDMPDSRDISQTGAVEGPGVRLSAVQKGKLREWDARIVRSEGVVDEKSRVTYAVAQVDDPYSLHREGDPLPLGTFVAASIEGRAAIETLRVPRGAVRGSDELLFVNGENRLEIRKVDILRADAEYAFIASGAAAGERIVTSAIEAPTEGMLVRTGEETEEETEEDLEAEEQLAAQPVED